MTPIEIGWIVIGVNLALVVLNMYHMIRLRRSRLELDRLVDEFQKRQRPC